MFIIWHSEGIGSPTFARCTKVNWSWKTPMEISMSCFTFFGFTLFWRIYKGLEIKLVNEVFNEGFSMWYFLNRNSCWSGCQRRWPEIFILLTFTDPKVVGFKTKKLMNKNNAQFADDTTLLLGGHLNSLQLALNILEVFAIHLGWWWIKKKQRYYG